MDWLAAHLAGEGVACEGYAPLADRAGLADDLWRAGRAWMRRAWRGPRTNNEPEDCRSSETNDHVCRQRHAHLPANNVDRKNRRLENEPDYIAERVVHRESPGGPRHGASYARGHQPVHGARRDDGEEEDDEDDGGHSTIIPCTVPRR